MPNLKRYPMDISGIIHMISKKRGKTNSFRLDITLDEPVRPELLREAFRAVTPRFPTLVAGVREGFFRYYLVPTSEPVDVRPDGEFIAWMSPDELRRQAMRVLYRECTVSVEFFHSLTDGYGGFTFFRALLAEYLRLAHGLELPEDAGVPLPGQEPDPAEIEDSFLTHAGSRGTSAPSIAAYLPCSGETDLTIRPFTGSIPVQSLREVSRRHSAGMTTFLTAILAQSLLELQQTEAKKKCRPIRIMVPVDLRRRFLSRTLHNFSLFATVHIDAAKTGASLEELIRLIDGQLKDQITPEHFAGIMASNALLETHPLLRIVPLRIKTALIWLGYQFLGERTSSLSMSNLGDLRFPDAMLPYIRGVGVYLSPRSLAAFNCGIISFNGQLSVHFTRRCRKPKLETIFFSKLAALGCTATILRDGTES